MWMNPFTRACAALCLVLLAGGVSESEWLRAIATRWVDDWIENWDHYQ
jgi:hypothetical protein